MKIAILGSGGREHAIAYSISKSKKIEKIFCLPGNAGTDIIAENIIVDINNFEQVYDFLKKEKIEALLLMRNLQNLWEKEQYQLQMLKKHLFY